MRLLVIKCWREWVDNTTVLVCITRTLRQFENYFSEEPVSLRELTFQIEKLRPTDLNADLTTLLSLNILKTKNCIRDI